MLYQPEKRTDSQLLWQPRASGSNSFSVDGTGSLFQYSSVYNDGTGLWGKDTGYTKLDLNDVDNLAMYMESVGLKPPKEKRNFLVRFLDFISRPLYASAGFTSALLDEKQERNPLEAAWAGLSGREKITYSDVLREQGVENKWVRGGVGFALDVVLDPTTYFGAGLIRAGMGAVKSGARSGINVMRKFNPKAVEALEQAGKSLKDAVGYTFDVNYNLTRKYDKQGKVVGTVVDDFITVNNTTNQAYNELLTKNQQLFGSFSKNSIREAADIMVHNRRIEYGIREGIEGFSPSQYLTVPKGEVGEVVSVMKKLGKDISEKAALMEKGVKPYEWYIPMQQAIDDVGKKGLMGARTTIVKDDFMKKFEDKVLPKGKTLMDPIEAFTRAEGMVMRDNLMRSFLSDVTSTYGVTMSKARQMIKKDAGFRDILRKDYVPMFEKGTSGKQIGWIKKEDYRIIDKIQNVEMNVIDALAKATGFDTFTRVFKTAVTSYFPAFHVRNAISSFVQNYSVFGAQAFNPKTVREGLAIMKGSKNVMIGRYRADVVHDAFKKRFDRSSRYISDLGKSITEGMDGTFRVGKLKDPGRAVGNFIELNQKAQGVSIALRNGETLERALYLAEKAGFDYSMLTKFESSVMKRLIPFYTFARKNAELQVRTMVKNPERILNQIKFTKNLGEIFGGKLTEEDLKGLPEWALNSLGFKVSDGRFLTKFGLPIEEFLERIDKPMKTTLVSANPLIKFPLESYLGYDFFRDQKIIDINRIAPGTGKALMSDKAPDWIKDMMNVKTYKKPDGTLGYTASPRALHVLRTLPTSRAQGTLESLFDGDKPAVDKWLAFLSGVRIYDIDLELNQYFKERDLIRDMQDMLMMMNEGKKFEQFYIPKNK